eukprot:553669_1
MTDSYRPRPQTVHQNVTKFITNSNAIIKDLVQHNESALWYDVAHTLNEVKIMLPYEDWYENLIEYEILNTKSHKIIRIPSIQFIEQTIWKKLSEDSSLNRLLIKLLFFGSHRISIKLLFFGSHRISMNILDFDSRISWLGWITYNNILVHATFGKLTYYPHRHNMAFEVAPIVPMIENANNNLQFTDIWLERKFVYYLTLLFQANEKSTLDMAFLGALMFFNKNLAKMLQNTPKKELIQEIQKQINVNARIPLYSGVNNNASAIYEKLQKWRLNIVKYGEKYIRKAYKMSLKNDAGIISNNEYFIFAKFFYSSQDYETAKIYWIITSCTADSFYIRAISMKYLSKTCYHFGEYQIALKTLNHAYKICYIGKDIGIIAPYFIQCEYSVQKELIKKKLNKIVCGYSFCTKTNNDSLTLRACSGCMKIMYCSKSHQKKDWNSTHRTQCNRKWNKNYKTLKSIVFALFSQRC